MRQRKIKNLDAKIEELGDYIISQPEMHKGNWLDAFEKMSAGESNPAETGSAEEADRAQTGSAGSAGREAAGKTVGRDRNEESAPRLYLEIGCGKGQFLTRRAKMNPGDRFIGFEGQASVAYQALRKIRSSGLDNARLVMQYVDKLSDLFGDSEVSGIYLNFSDPWPKERHAKRRLTHGSKLEDYVRVLSVGSTIEMKTDNEGLFAYSLEQFRRQPALTVELVSHDLHGAGGTGFVRDTKSDVLSGWDGSLGHDLRDSGLSAAEIRCLETQVVTTEYEDRFVNQGKRIHFLLARKRQAWY